MRALRPFSDLKDPTNTIYDHLPYRKDINLIKESDIRMVSGNVVKYTQLVVEEAKIIDTNELAEIAIVDEGIGIYESLTQNTSHKEYITDNITALKWALKAGISEAFGPSKKQKSQDSWANSGFGLYMVNEICKHLNGSFCLISYGNYLLIDNHGIKEGETLFKLSLIHI